MLGGGGLPSHDARRWASGPHLRHSLGCLRAILEHLDRHDVRMHRMATALAPYASHPDLPQFHDQVAECAAQLAEIGAAARGRRAELRYVLPQLRAHADLIDPIGFEAFLRDAPDGRDFD